MEFRYVKDLPVIYVKPGRRLAEVVVEVKEGVGIIADLSGVMSDNGINILYLLANTDGLRGRLTFFIDVTNSRLSLVELRDIIKSKPYTISVDVWRSPVDGVVYDALCFPIMVDGFQAFIMRYETISSEVEEFRRRAGKEAVVIFYHLGYYLGYAYGKYIKKRLEPLNLPLKDIVKIAFDLNRSFGEFNSELVMLDVDGGRTIVRVYDSCEATPIRGRMKIPSCQYVRGGIAGILSSLLGREVVVERKCIAAGDTYCEFHIEPRKHEASNVEQCS